MCNLPARIGIPQNLLSHHLKVLKDAGLIQGTKRGRWMDYAANAEALERLRAAVPQSQAHTCAGAV